MAGHLASAGHEVTVYNRTAAKALEWVAEHGHRAAPTAAEAVEGAEFVMMCVGNDHDVREVASAASRRCSRGDTRRPHDGVGDGRPRARRRVRRARPRLRRRPGVGRASRRPERPAHRDVRLQRPSVFDAAREVIMAYARECRLLGPAGAGQTDEDGQPDLHRRRAAGAGGGVVFAQKAGLDIDEVVATISKGAAGSWQMENRARTMARASSTSGSPSSGCARTWRSASTRPSGSTSGLPLTALVDQFYKQVVERGGRRWDTSSLVHLLQNP